MISAAPKPTPRKVLKARRKRKQAKADRSVYDLVTERDRRVCRVCWSGRYVARHHLRGRKHTTTKDVVLLCAVCHSDLHPRLGGKRLRLEGNADQKLTATWLPTGDVWTV